MYEAARHAIARRRPNFNREYYTFSNRVRKITVRGANTFAAYELLRISQILITCKNIKILKIGRVLS